MHTSYFPYIIVVKICHPDSEL